MSAFALATGPRAPAVGPVVKIAAQQVVGETRETLGQLRRVDVAFAPQVRASREAVVGSCDEVLNRLPALRLARSGSCKVFQGRG